MQSVFITGTDTGVGKTSVTAALLAEARARGVDAVPMKPVQTGCVRRKGEWSAPDLSFCLRQAGLFPEAEEYADLAPYRFPLPVSPHWAAQEAGGRISIPRIVSAFRRLRARHEAVLVEGAGGVLVPLSNRATMLDMILALDCSVLVVARPSLGTLNHTLLTLKALRSAGLSVAGVVLNAVSPGVSPRMIRSNIEALETFGQTRVAGPFPYDPNRTSRQARKKFRAVTATPAGVVLDWLC